MFRTTLKNLLSRKLRLVLSGLAVVLGVMFVAGAFVLTETLGKSFNNLFATVYEGVDVRVSGKPRIDLPETSGDSVPTNIPASLLRTVQDVPQVEKATPVVEADGARVIGKNGKVITTFGAPRLGVNWTGEDDIVQLRDGIGPQSDDQVAINATLAKADDFKVGDQIQILTLAPKRTFTVSGIFGYTGDRDSLAGELTVAFTTPVAQQLMLGEKDVYTNIETTAKPGVSQDQLRNAIAAAVGSGYEVKTGEQLTKEQTDSLKEGLSFFNYILLGFAGIALFVGIFLILNTFSIIVAQRTRELALMRAIGASRNQMIGSVLIEAVVIGLVAAVLGLLAGIGVGWLLAGLFTDGAGVAVPLSAVISSFVVGVLVTVVAAMIPAFRASRVPPIAAMRDAATPDKPLTKVTVLGAIVLVLGATALGLGLAGVMDDATLWTILGGVLVAFIGVALLTPIIARPVVSVLGRLFSWSMPGKLGRRNSARNPRRTAITAAALMVGVALVTGVSVIFTSAKESISKAVDAGVQAELVIAGEQTTAIPPTFDQSVVKRTEALPGVAAVAALWQDLALVNGKQTTLAATNSVPALQEIFELKAKEGTIGPLEPNQVIVDDRWADDVGARAGSSVRIQLSRGEQAMYTVAAVYDRNEVFSGWVLPESSVPRFRSPNPSQALIQVRPGTDVGQVKREVEALLADSPEVTVQDRSDYVEQQTSIFDTILNMVQILLALAIIIAVLGIVNTLALSVIERTRELGLLRAVGMRRSQTMRMITVESVIISVFGALLGIVVGCALGAAVVRALKDEGFTDLGFPWTQMAVYLVLAAVVGVFAAIIPAIRAARLNVLNAIAYE